MEVHHYIRGNSYLFWSSTSVHLMKYPQEMTVNVAQTQGLERV